MKDRIVLDVEIRQLVGEDGLTWDDTDKLGVSCAAVYEYRTDRFRVYGPSGEDLARLRDRIEAADEVIGFNVLRFDLHEITGTLTRALEDAARQSRALDDGVQVANARSAPPKKSLRLGPTIRRRP